MPTSLETPILSSFVPPSRRDDRSALPSATRVDLRPGGLHASVAAAVPGVRAAGAAALPASVAAGRVAGTGAAVDDASASLAEPARAGADGPAAAASPGDLDGDGAGSPRAAHRGGGIRVGAFLPVRLTAGPPDRRVAHRAAEPRRRMGHRQPVPSRLDLAEPRRTAAVPGAVAVQLGRHPRGRRAHRQLPAGRPFGERALRHGADRPGRVRCQLRVDPRVPRAISASSSWVRN